jgi:hypothetical protein
MSNAPPLYILVKNPFVQRDYQRMGIEELQRHFEVRILDCTAWLMPKAIETRGQSTLDLANLVFIHSLADLRREIKGDGGGFAVDYVGQFSLTAILLFHHLRKKRIKLVVMDSGAYPLPNEEKISVVSESKLAYALKSNYLRRVLDALCHKTLIKILPDQTPDFALVSGGSWRAYPRFSRAKKIISAHSFDYDRYLQLKNAPPLRDFDYAVYLDENITDHEDNVELGYTSPVSAKRFLSSFNRFLYAFEQASGMPVLVAGYPTSRQELRHGMFGDREMIYGQTAELIRDAKVVFAHASTAISFAVVWRRPVIFLTSDEMAQSWYQPWIAAPCNILGSALVNIDIDLPEPENVARWQGRDAAGYQAYEETYIKSAGSPEVSMWDIFLEVKRDGAVPLGSAQPVDRIGKRGH